MMPPFDPDAERLHRAMSGLGLPPLETLTPGAARALLADLRRAAATPPQPLHAVEDLSAGGLALRLYRPAEGVLPVVVFYHGGGWVLGDLDSHEPLCRRLAALSGAAVLAVDYRLAPEHRFPAAVEDAATALHWLAAQGAGLGLDPGRVAVMGDSAGGNLAAVMAILARDGQVPPIALQVLAYPATDMSLTQGSHRLQMDGLVLNGSTVRWFRDHYLGPDPAHRLDWRAAPLLAERLDGVAPCVIATAGIDPLCDEGLAYAARLAAAGVRLDHRHYPGQVHGFLTAGIDLPTSRRELALMAARLAQALDGGADAAA